MTRRGIGTGVFILFYFFEDYQHSHITMKRTSVMARRICLVLAMALASRLPRSEAAFVNPCTFDDDYEQTIARACAKVRANIVRVARRRRVNRRRGAQRLTRCEKARLTIQSINWYFSRGAERGGVGVSRVATL